MVLGQLLLGEPDHLADDSAPAGAVQARGHVAQVPLVVGQADLGRGFVLEPVQGLPGLGHDNLVTPLTSRHALHLHPYGVHRGGKVLKGMPARVGGSEAAPDHLAETYNLAATEAANPSL